MSVEKEFPQFDEALPVIEGFVDTSYHHDVCPSLSNEGLGLQLMVDYREPSDSEYPELRRSGEVGRYRLLTLEEADLVLNTDDLNEVLDTIKAMSPAQP